MTTYTCVLPVAYPPYGQACLDTIKFPRDRLLVIDNSVSNRGVMRSHNMGIDQMVAQDSDWLIVLSAAIRFGPPGGMDFIDALATHADHAVVEAHGVYGWHAIAFSRQTIDLAGRWDENFCPYGFDDLDYSTRISLTHPAAQWTKVPVDCTDMGMAHSLHLAGVVAPAGPRLNYYTEKWGVTIDEEGAKSEPQYIHPFNDVDKPPTWWPTPPDPRSILPTDWEPL